MPRTGITVIAAVLLLFPAVLSAQNPLTESEAMAVLLREAASTTAAHVSEGSVRLKVTPDNAPQAVMQIFSEELQKRGSRVMLADAPAEEVLGVDVRDIHSSTVSRGNSSYFRTMHVTLGVLLENIERQQVSWSQEFQLVRTDTLDGEAPFEYRDCLLEDESVTGGLLEPLLVTAAAVVIAILLFTVRGS